MQHLEVSCAVRPIYWPLGVKWLKKGGFHCKASRRQASELYRYRNILLKKMFFGIWGGGNWVPTLPCTLSLNGYFCIFQRSCVWPDDNYHRKSKHVAILILTDRLCQLKYRVHNFLKSISKRGPQKDSFLACSFV